MEGNTRNGIGFLEESDNEASTPEKNLLKHILWRAVRDLTVSYSEISTANTREKREENAAIIRASASRYLTSDNDGPFSCKWICDHLGVDHSKVVEMKEIYLKNMGEQCEN